MLKAPNWLNHLEYEWRSPVWGPFLAELARHCRLVRFDQRGNGLSDWEVKEISVDAMIADTGGGRRRRRARTVRAPWNLAGLRVLDPLCASKPRASHLSRPAWRVICAAGSGAPSRSRSKLFEGLTTMIRDGWGSPNPVFRHFFTSTFIPDAPPEVAGELRRTAADRHEPGERHAAVADECRDRCHRAGETGAHPHPRPALQGRPRRAAGRRAT